MSYYSMWAVDRTEAGSGSTVSSFPRKVSSFREVISNKTHLQQGGRDYTCICEPEFGGRNCQTTLCDGEDDARCLNGGQCVIENGNSTCRCMLGYAGSTCATAVSINPPYFTSNGYLRYGLPNSDILVNNLTIGITFRPESPDGLILYGQSTSSMGDYFALSLKEGRLVFEFDLGDGTTAITSDPLSLGSEMTVNIRREELIGLMNITGQGSFTVESAGNYTSLNVNDYIFVGGSEDLAQSQRRTNVQTGFTGCILMLQMQGIPFSFHPGSALSGRNVVNCDANLCETQPCQNGATCTPTTGSYTCACLPGYHGYLCDVIKDNCEDGHLCVGDSVCVSTSDSYDCLCGLGQTGTYCSESYNVSSLIPSFTGRSYLAYPLVTPVSDQTAVSLLLRPSTPTGLLVYLADNLTTDGDFLALILVEGVVQLRFDLGSGVSVVSGSTISLNTWHTVHVQRSGNSADLTVDGNTVHHDGSGLVELSAGDTAYIGGLPVSVRPSDDVGVFQGISGCMHNIQAAGGLDVRFCNHTECSLLPCLNDGVCQIINDTAFTCLCGAGWTGTHCEEAASIRVPSFGSSSFLIFEDVLAASASTAIDVEFKASDDDGVLFWNSDGTDFIGLGLVGGRMVFTFDLGSGPSYIFSNTRVALGDWHTVSASRTGLWTTGYDNELIPASGQSTGANTGLSVGSRSFIGGLPPEVMIPGRAGLTGGFFGCIRRITVNNVDLELDQPSQGSEVMACSDQVCNLNPDCRNGATCLDDPSSDLMYQCVCPAGFTGILCEISACQTLPTEDQCQNGGTCFLSGQGQPDCLCSLGFGGDRCSIVVDYNIPQFSGRSFIEFSRAVIASDFFAVGVKNRNVELHVNLGDGVLSVVAEGITINFNQLYSISIERVGTAVTMIVQDTSGNMETVEGSTSGSQTGLNTFGSSLYIGGHPDNVRELTGGIFHQGLDGCIIQLATARNPTRNLVTVNLQQEPLSGAGISNCS
ncbi:putative neurogenic locus notch-like protein 1-like [Apostichopus japonicus]|uniref:Putative neurogenic locus notch-like protein 1-like n=1 Tax=Stichopus japonicus TaxID=307972 RepID=A0A2G8KMA1_STIJA|nr:putative neurogenic locus notch-like protein 1-like [Apostichopus japonicus]